MDITSLAVGLFIGLSIGVGVSAWIDYKNGRA